MSDVTHFRADGDTFVAALDGERLGTQLERVRDFALKTGAWLTLAELAKACGGTEASVSARLRDLRKPRFGGYLVERERTERGLHFYRVRPPPPSDTTQPVQEELFPGGAR